LWRQINVMDISKVFKVGRKAIADNPEFTDDQLTVVITGFVETIRKN